MLIQNITMALQLITNQRSGTIEPGKMNSIHSMSKVTKLERDWGNVLYVVPI